MNRNGALCKLVIGLILLTSFHLCPRAGAAADKLAWDRQSQRLDATVQGWPLPRLLQKMAAATGWQIFLEPNTSHTVSTTFTNRPTGEALRLLLGDLSFALVPQTGAAPKLFVFRTSLQEATLAIQGKADEGDTAPKPIPNQLIVRLKPGQKIEDLAKELGAKVIGRIEGLNAYLLEFPDEASANAAREKLKENPAVASVESNFKVDRPPPIDPLAISQSRALTLRPKAVGAGDRIIIGLIDTGIQRQGGALDAFLLATISVAEGGSSSGNLPTHSTTMAATMLQTLSLMLEGKDSKVRILPVDVYGNKTTSSTFDVAYGIVQAINNGAMIINLSLGSDGDTPFLHDVIKSGKEQGVVFFAAAGNEPVTTPTYPAAYPETTAVTAVDPGGKIAPYANHGSFVDVGGPGTSLVDFNGQRYLVMGTSPATASAAAFVAGYVDVTGKSFADGERAVRRVMSAPTATTAPKGK